MLTAKIFLAATPLFIAGLPPTWQGTVPRTITSSHSYPAQHAETEGASANCWLNSW